MHSGWIKKENVIISQQVKGLSCKETKVLKIERFCIYFKDFGNENESVKVRIGVLLRMFDIQLSSLRIISKTNKNYYLHFGESRVLYIEKSENKYKVLYRIAK